MEILDPNSDAALKTIDIQQALVARMATQSAAAKSWCITVVSAVTIFAADKSKPASVLIALIPTILFCVLDIYYLTLERTFRVAHNSFCKRLAAGDATTEDLFLVGGTDFSFKDTYQAALSRSVWPFYLLVSLALTVTYAIVSGK